MYKRAKAPQRTGDRVNASSKEEDQRMPWLFRHQDLIDTLESAKPVKQKNLTDILNHINFVDGHVLVQMRHPRYEESVLVKASPDPCLDGELTCTWSDQALSGIDLEEYQFQSLVIDDGRSMIVVPAVLSERNGKRFLVQLPPKSYAVGKRQAKRFTCRDVAVVLDQSGFLAKGTLLDFSSDKFRVRVRPEKFCSFHWFNSDEPVMIQLRDNERVLFSGMCKCVREGSGTQKRELVLSPLSETIKRFKKEQVRNPRQRLSPSPTLVFDHPFLKRRVQLEVSDISTSGFSVHESAGDGILMPGMIIPELTIDFAGVSGITCSAQVIYRLEEDEKHIRYALSILDMDINAYSRLTNILGNALDAHAHISNEVDMDDLWEFFFETGFIYPKKYGLVESNRKDFKETYRKLYQENPEIARHFTYQKNGRICAHVSAVRAYEKTWMVQHHISRTVDGERAGLQVLKQIMHFLNDLFRLLSAKADYVMVHFRPENRFPNLVFGGFARALKNPKGCSTDLFAYLSYTSRSLGKRLPEGWLLQESSDFDIWELRQFYEYHSGGLLLDVLGLEKRDSENESLEDLYGRLGLVRTWKAFSLMHAGEVNAVFIVDRSDLGLNLSELLNGIKIIVTNPESLSWDVLSIAIGQLTSLYDMDTVPILIYPMTYLDSKIIPYEKRYQLWIYEARFMGQLMEFLARKFKISYWK